MAWNSKYVPGGIITSTGRYGFGYRDLRRGRRTPAAVSHGKLALLLGLTALCLLTVVRYLEKPRVRQEDAAPVSDYIDEERLTQDIVRILGGQGGTYGVFVEVVRTGEQLEVRSREQFFAASCYKLPLALMAYEAAESGEVNLDRKVEYLPEDREAGTGIIIGYKYGTQFTLRELVRLAVVKSDNVAANMLLRYFGKERFIEYQKQAGASVIPETANYSSPADLGMFAGRLLEFASQNGPLGQELLGYFIGSEFKDRIPALLPGDVKVANKIGTWPGTVNDVGIVMKDEIVFILAVMSRDVPSVEGAANAIARISSEVYNHIAARAETALEPG